MDYLTNKMVKDTDQLPSSFLYQLPQPQQLLDLGVEEPCNSNGPLVVQQIWLM